MFPDPDLQALIRTALAQNYDLRVAASRILQAQSQVTVARSQEFPTLDGAFSAPYAGYSGSDRPSTFPDYTVTPQLGLGFAWELDFWGKYRRNTEAARADLLATEEARYVVVATLVTQVGQAYLTLRALDLSLEISRRTVDSRKQSVDLVQARLDGGVAGVLDLRQAESLLYGATKAIPEIQRQIEQTENFINVLLGQVPGPIKRGRPLDAADRAAEAAARTAVRPADAAPRRPQCGAATGVAPMRRSASPRRCSTRRSRFPDSAAGAARRSAAPVSGRSGSTTRCLPSPLPIFNMGRLQANVEYNEARAQEAGLRYQQTLQQAFREVSDALVEIRKRQEFRLQQELLVKALEDASQIAKLRYEGGVSSYLEVLDTERQLFDAEIQLVQAKRDESQGVIQLYKALGGGWRAEPSA